MNFGSDVSGFQDFLLNPFLDEVFCEKNLLLAGSVCPQKKQTEYSIKQQITFCPFFFLALLTHISICLNAFQQVGLPPQSVSVQAGGAFRSDVHSKFFCGRTGAAIPAWSRREIIQAGSYQGNSCSSFSVDGPHCP